MIVGSSPKLFWKTGISVSQNTSNQFIEKNEKNHFELFFLGRRLWIFLGFLFLFIGHELVRLLKL